MAWGIHTCSKCEVRFKTYRIYRKESYKKYNGKWSSDYKGIGWGCGNCGHVDWDK